MLTKEQNSGTVGPEDGREMDFLSILLWGGRDLTEWDSEQRTRASKHTSKQEKDGGGNEKEKEKGRKR